MATDAELKTAGFVLPTGDDLISKGDDAISANARATANWVDDHAVSQRDLIADGTDLNTVIRNTGRGVYYIPSASSWKTLDNRPDDIYAATAILIVHSGPRGYSYTSQEIIVLGSRPARLSRVMLSTSTWSPWRPVDSARGGLIAENTDMNDLSGYDWVGEYYVPTTAVAESLSNYPTPSKPAIVKIMSGPHGYRYTTQTVIEWGESPTIYWRAMASASTWTPWMTIGGGGTETPPVGDSHTIREQLFKDDYPLASTGGKGVIAFRYDHGLTNIKSTILPIHQAHDVPLYIAMNSRNWDIDENNGATQADARDWIASGLVEFGNHSADHADRNTNAGIYDTIVNGRKELEAQLEIPIHGYTVPGLSGYNEFEGFGTGSLDAYSETYAGGLILANHGIVSGQYGQQYRTLDGVVRQGGRHWTWEKEQWPSIKARIDQAVSTKTALTIMVHPRYMGLDGYYDAALVEQVVAYVRSLIDNGDLARMSYYQSLHAEL